MASIRIHGETLIVRFITGLLIPTLVAGLVTCGALAAFLQHSANSIDAELAAHQEEVSKHALVEHISTTPTWQEEFAVWDEAVAAYEDADTEWLLENLGQSVFQYHNIPRIMVFNSAGEPLMVLRDGGEVPVASAAAGREALSPVFEQLRSLDMVAAISAYKEGLTDVVPMVELIAPYEGKPSLITAIPLLSETGELESAAGGEGIYVWVSPFDQALADSIGDHTLLKGTRFAPMPPLEGHPAVPVMGTSGQVLTWLTWTPERPGTRLLQQGLPGLLAGLAVAAGIVGLLLHRLRQALQQLQAEREEAHYRALHDPLTGLGNRSLFQTRLSHSIKSMPRGEPRLALLAIDLDHFKPVNDTLGHAAGDELLRQTASRIKALLGPEDTLVRLGGDEFAVIQPTIQTHNQPEALARAIIAALSQPFLVAGTTVNIGASLGIATAPDLAADETELARHADQALYRAKNGGRNRYCVYRPELASEPERLQAEIERAFENKSGSAA